MSTNNTGASPAPGGANRRAQLQQQREAEARRQRRNRMMAIAAAVLALVVIAVAGTVLFQKKQDEKAASSAAQVVPPNHNADNTGIVVQPGKAKAGAPTLVVYQDYQCPACKQKEDELGQFTNDLVAKGEIGLEYRTMTFLDINLRNDSSQRAGVAAACADTVGAYEKYHDVVYSHQPTQEGQGYTDQQLSTDFAAEAGITGAELTKFQSCYQQRATQNFVKGTDDAAGKAGITSTPTYQVNGKKIDFQKVPTPTTEQAWLALIQQVAAG